MIELPFAKMVCDTAQGAGGLYFFDQYFEWRPKSAALVHLGFQVRYEDVQNCELTPSRKKQVKIDTKDGKTYILMLYKIENFTVIMNERLANAKNGKKPPVLEQKEEPAQEDKFAKLQQLAEMREKNLLTEEEFKAAKAKLLGL